MPLHPGVGAGPPGQGCSADDAASWDVVPVCIGWAGTEGTWQGHGAGMKELLPGCLCLAAAGFDSWYSPPFSGVTLGSALRMRRPRRRKTPGLMVLPGMLCMSGAELGLGLKSVPEVPGQLKLCCLLWQLVVLWTGGTGGGAVPRTRWCPASHPAYLCPNPALGSG